ncbi:MULTISPECIES: STAS domain-containing protein [Streptomyces]|uniref:STAS domain-containing protein n=1 Tax=Streptomyces noboritoensis TaxID=67337 RepID=A0ABV6TB79_9ACTN
MHPPLYTDALLRIWGTADPPGLRLAGQVDVTNQAALVGHLLAVDKASADVTVDLNEVTFLNFASLHVLVAFAELLEPGRRLIVHTRTGAVAEMLRACGWDRPEVPLTLLEEIPDE